MAPPSPGLRERKKQERRQAILYKSRRLFDRDGFEGTSIEDVAAEVDVSVGTIYKFFPTKIDILSSLLREDLQSHMSTAEQVNAVNAPIPEDGIYRLIEQMLLAMEKLSKNALLLVTAHAIATGQNTETGRTYVAADEDLRGEIYALLSAYQDAGAVPPDTDLKLVCGLVFSAAHGDYISWLAGEYASIDHVLERLRRFYTIIFAGVAAESLAVTSQA